MAATDDKVKELLEKIRTLSCDKIAQVEGFVDFLRRREDKRGLTEAAAKLSEEAFYQVWDNPDNSDYDQL